MNQRLFLWSLTSALAGFLFGFDTVVISGAEKTIQSLWTLGNFEHGLAMSMALWGTVLGSLLGGWPADRFGRRKTLLYIGVLYFVSAVWSGMATDVYSFMIARFIGGIGVGVSTVAAPLYISEIAPPEHRGRLTGMFQFNIVFGILIAYVSNSLLEGIGENAWRWMLGVEAIPALIYSVMCLGLPESPRWLILKKNDREAARSVLLLATPDASATDLDRQLDTIQSEASQHEVRRPFWRRGLQKPICLAFLIAFFNQLSGINAILYFAPRIFQLTGLESEAALLQSVGIGVTNLVFTFAGLWLIDRLGRRTLLYVGSVGYILSLGLCAWTFHQNAESFAVANAAISVKSTTQTVAGMDARPELTDADRTSIQKSQQAAITALNAATAAEGFPGEAASIESSNSDQVLESANALLKESAGYTGNSGTLVLFCIFAFIAAHAIGQGAVIWVFISEIFPGQHRAQGQSLGSFTHWIFAALLTQFFPAALAAFSPASVFGFFAFMMVLQLFWVKVSVPETKGVPLEQMQTQLGIQED